jgi:lipopolysaccharide export system protein LptC
MSTTINENVQSWRVRAQDGTITLDEMKLAIEAIRKERAATEAAPKAPRTRAAASKKQKPEDINSDDLLKELGGL